MPLIADSHYRMKKTATEVTTPVDRNSSNQATCWRLAIPPDRQTKEPAFNHFTVLFELQKPYRQRLKVQCCSTCKGWETNGMPARRPQCDGYYRMAGASDIVEYTYQIADSKPVAEVTSRSFPSFLPSNRGCLPNRFQS